MEPDDRHRQTVEHALAIEGEIEGAEQRAAQFVNRPLQLTPAAIEAGARGLVGEEVAVLRPFAQEHRLLVPPLAFPDQRHCHQLRIGALRRRTRPPIQRRDLVPTIVDEAVGPQAEVLEAGYHHGGSPSGWGGVKHRIRTRAENLFQPDRTSTLAYLVIPKWTIQ